MRAGNKAKSVIPETDWERIMNMSEEEALQNALDDSDNPPLTDAELAKAVRVKNVPRAAAAQRPEKFFHERN